MYREWGVEWAAELTREIAEGTLIDMGHEDFYPCPDHPGVNIANRPCYRCGRTKPETEASWKYADRGWRDRDETPMIGQLDMMSQAQMELHI